MPAITDLVVDPTNAQNLYVRANSAIYRSTDGGASWLVSFGSATSHLIMAPGDPRTAILVTVAWTMGALLIAPWLDARRDA